MNLSGPLEQLARRALRIGVRHHSSALLTIGGISYLAARLGRRTPEVVYREELPVGTTLTISYHDPKD